MAAFNKLVVKSYPRIASRETSDTKFWNKYSVRKRFTIVYLYSRKVLKKLKCETCEKFAL